jgi:FMN reductase
MTRPYVVGIGGTTRYGSSTERALEIVLGASRDRGAEVLMLRGRDIDLPAYSPHEGILSQKAAHILAELKKADGIILGSPAYHGGISGLVKNALDYVEGLRGDERPYLHGRAVGCVVTADGEQGAVTTLNALRAVVHSLRGWPTPLGVTIVNTQPVFAVDGRCLVERVEKQLHLLSEQIMAFASRMITMR